MPDLPPRTHDHEAGGSSSAMDPALLAILEGMRADQRRAAEEQARRDRDQAAINAAIQARQDELQRQFLAFQAQQTAMMADLMAASGIQLPQIQIPDTSSVRPSTLALQSSHRSSIPLRVSHSRRLSTRSLRVLSRLALSRYRSLCLSALDLHLSQRQRHS